MDLNKSFHIGQLKRAGIALLLLTMTFGVSIKAQDSLIKPVPIHLSVDKDFDVRDTGLIKKIGKIFRFKENRNRKERERMYHYVKELVKDGELKVDTTNVEELVKLLVQLQDSLNSLGPEERFEISSINQQVLQRIIETFREESFMNEQFGNLSINRERLKTLRKVESKCQCFIENELNKRKKDSTCLQPVTNIIGWHQTGQDLPFENYNYNYLSSINLYGYQLAADGSMKNPEVLEEINEVIDLAKRRCTKTFLTIYNSSPKEVSAFLRNQKSQYDFIENLLELISKEGIDGINFYFEAIPKVDRNAFTEFVHIFRKKSYSKFGAFPIIITLPAVYDDNSRELVYAFDFQVLNTLVDFFIVRTDRLINLTTRDKAGPLSPLFRNEANGYGTMQSTADFYTNGNIPSWKLIMSVSYLGVVWPMNNEMEKLEYTGITKPRLIQYKEIVGRYLNNNLQLAGNLQQRLDTVQAAAFINVGNQENNSDYQQIWYENPRSLDLKYNWVLNNKLGGVSIIGLGYDDGYTELWDILGISLVSIEKVSVDTEISPSGHKDSGPIDYSIFTLLLFILVGTSLLIYLGRTYFR